MLSGDFFIIKTLQTEDTAANALLELNTEHLIFKGHFPGQPVVPGACLLQMVKEIMQTITGMELRLVKAHQIKFLSIIDPVKNHILRIIIKHSINEKSEISVSATFSQDIITCCKFSGLFKAC